MAFHFTASHPQMNGESRKYRSNMGHPPPAVPRRLSQIYNMYWLSAMYYYRNRGSDLYNKYQIQYTNRLVYGLARPAVTVRFLWSSPSYSCLEAVNHIGNLCHRFSWSRFSNYKSTKSYHGLISTSPVFWSQSLKSNSRLNIVQIYWSYGRPPRPGTPMICLSFEIIVGFFFQLKI